MCNVGRLRLRVHTSKVEAAAWLEGGFRICDQCPGEHVQNEVHAPLSCQDHRVLWAKHVFLLYVYTFFLELLNSTTLAICFLQHHNCNRSTTSLFIISFLSRTLDFSPFVLNSSIYCLLARTSRRPISQTVWLKVPPHCNHRFFLMVLHEVVVPQQTFLTFNIDFRHTKPSSHTFWLMAFVTSWSVIDINLTFSCHSWVASSQQTWLLYCLLLSAGKKCTLYKDLVLLALEHNFLTKSLCIAVVPYTTTNSPSPCLFTLHSLCMCLFLLDLKYFWYQTQKAERKGKKVQDIPKQNDGW